MALVGIIVFVYLKTYERNARCCTSVRTCSSARIPSVLHLYQHSFLLPWNRCNELLLCGGVPLPRQISPSHPVSPPPLWHLRPILSIARLRETVVKTILSKWRTILRATMWEEEMIQREERLIESKLARRRRGTSTWRPAWTAAARGGEISKASKVKLKR